MMMLCIVPVSTAACAVAYAVALGGVRAVHTGRTQGTHGTVAWGPW